MSHNSVALTVIQDAVTQIIRMRQCEDRPQSRPPLRVVDIENLPHRARQPN